MGDGSKSTHRWSLGHLLDEPVNPRTLRLVVLPQRPHVVTRVPEVLGQSFVQRAGIVLAQSQPVSVRGLVDCASTVNCFDGQALGPLDDLMKVGADVPDRSEEHTSELQSPVHLVCRLLLEKTKRTSQCAPSPSASPLRCCPPAAAPRSRRPAPRRSPRSPPTSTPPGGRGTRPTCSWPSART